MRKLLFLLLPLLLIAPPSIVSAWGLPSFGGGSGGPAPLYVALGDSVSSGYGNATQANGACARMKEGHPFVTRDKLGFEMTNVSCAGATVKKGIMGTQIRGYNVVSPQIDNLKAATVPGLITLTIGGNDVEFSTIYEKCHTATCGTDADTASYESALLAAQANIKTVYDKIQSLYGDNAPLTIAIAYPTIFPNNLYDCPSLNGISSSELAWLRDVFMVRLNQTIASAAADYPFVHYVQVDSYVGHEVCTGDSWFFGTETNGYLHPTARGQQVISDKVVEAYSLLTQ